MCGVAHGRRTQGNTRIQLTAWAGLEALEPFESARAVGRTRALPQGNERAAREGSDWLLVVNSCRRSAHGRNGAHRRERRDPAVITSSSDRTAITSRSPKTPSVSTAIEALRARQTSYAEGRCVATLQNNREACQDALPVQGPACFARRGRDACHRLSGAMRRCGRRRRNLRCVVFRQLGGSPRCPRVTKGLLLRTGTQSNRDGESAADAHVRVWDTRQVDPCPDTFASIRVHQSVLGSDSSPTCPGRAFESASPWMSRPAGLIFRQ